jgi:hypothetical protein
MVRRLGQDLVSTRVASSGSPTTRRTPTGAMDLGEALGMIGLARMAKHQRGGELGL